MLKTKVRTALIRSLQSVREVIVAVWKQLLESDVQLLAGSLAFSTVISLVPLLAVSLSVFSAYGGMESLMKKIEPFILQNFVDASGAELAKGFRRAIQRVHSGTLGMTGAFFLFLASTKLFYDMETAVHRVWQLPSKRWFVQKLIIYWVVMFSGPFLLGFALAFLASKDLGTAQYFSKGAIITTLEFICLLAIYKFVPSCPVRWKSAFIAATIATACMRLTQLFYSQITKNILSYSKIYGSLASIPIFLLWVLILWWICLTGVAICAALDQRRKSED